jgi:hypothetical protein
LELRYGSVGDYILVTSFDMSRFCGCCA